MSDPNVAVACGAIEAWNEGGATMPDPKACPLAQVAQITDGKVRRTWAFLSWEEAPETAGLTE